jgi:hypothetical protein
LVEVTSDDTHHGCDLLVTEVKVLLESFLVLTFVDELDGCFGTEGPLDLIDSETSLSTCHEEPFISLKWIFWINIE